MFLPSIKSKVAFILLIISCTLLILSIFLIIYIFPGIIKNEIHKNVRLTKNTEQYDRFVELPFPITFKVYLFNVENPSEIVNGSKPVIKEIGPYVYKEYRKKTIFGTDDDEDTISYSQTEKFEFDAEASGNLSDKDYITTLNTLMMGILQTAENLGQVNVISGCLEDIFPGINKIFIKVQVKDILFDGIQFCPYKFSMCLIQKTIACEMAATKKNVDKLPDNSLQFSFFNYKTKVNDTFTIKRGINDVQTLGRIVALNNSSYTHFWERLGPNSTCDEVKGTDSTLYPPQISKDTIFQIYSTDICRRVKIKFLKEAIYKGINGYVFATDNLTLRSNSATKEEDCFCAKETKGVNGEETCFLDGVIDMKPCTGVPVLLSFPHFLWADKGYREDVSGISPNEDLHKTFLLVEPETGTPLQGMERIQINAVLRPVGNNNRMMNLPRVVLPLLWVEEGVSLSDDYVEQLREMYFNKLKIVDIVKWSSLGISTALTIIFLIYLVFKRSS